MLIGTDAITVRSQKGKIPGFFSAAGGSVEDRQHSALYGKGDDLSSCTLGDIEPGTVI